MKCIHCEEEAVYDSPAVLCEEHWIKWWTGNDPNDPLGLTTQQAEEYYQEVKKWVKEEREKKQAKNQSKD